MEAWGSLWKLRRPLFIPGGNRITPAEDDFLRELSSHWGEERTHAPALYPPNAASVIAHWAVLMQLLFQVGAQGQRDFRDITGEEAQVVSGTSRFRIPTAAAPSATVRSYSGASSGSRRSVNFPQNPPESTEFRRSANSSQNPPEILGLPRIVSPRVPEAPYARDPRTLPSWEDTTGRTRLGTEGLPLTSSFRGRGRGYASRGGNPRERPASALTRGARGNQEKIVTQVFSRTEGRVAANEQVSVTGASHSLQRGRPRKGIRHQPECR